MDHAPGPIIARLSPSAAKMSGIKAALGREKAIQPSTRDTMIPVTGVQRPAIIRVPAAAPSNSGTAISNRRASVRDEIAQ